jgi:hypothetical protein
LIDTHEGVWNQDGGGRNPKNRSEYLRGYQKLVLSDIRDAPENQHPTMHALIHRGLSVVLFWNKHHAQELLDLGLRPETAFGCISKFLFRPSRTSVDLVRSTDLQLLQLMTNKREIKIGIQIRCGDREIRNQETSVMARAVAFDSVALPFFQCADLQLLLSSHFRASHI